MSASAVRHNGHGKHGHHGKYAEAPPPSVTLTPTVQHPCSLPPPPYGETTDPSTDGCGTDCALLDAAHNVGTPHRSVFVDLHRSSDAGGVTGSSQPPSVLAPYLPRLVRGWSERPDAPRSQVIDGTLVSIDISGFTALAERLAVHGQGRRRGARPAHLVGASTT